MSKLRAFIADDCGNHTIEFCIWLPLFFFFLAAIVDGAMIYLTHTEMWNVARDTARRMTTGQFNEAEAEQHAFEELIIGNRQVFVDATKENGQAVVFLSAFVADVSPFGVFGLFQRDGQWRGLTLDVRIEMGLEPEVSSVTPPAEPFDVATLHARAA